LHLDERVAHEGPDLLGHLLERRTFPLEVKFEVGKLEFVNFGHILKLGAKMGGVADDVTDADAVPRRLELERGREMRKGRELGREESQRT
jgi:hypothetical protein